MIGIYDVYYENKKCGKLTITAEGPRFHFLCSCEIVSENVLRLFCICGSDVVPIGVCIPESGSLKLNRTLSKNAIRGLAAADIDTCVLAASQTDISHYLHNGLPEHPTTVPSQNSADPLFVSESEHIPDEIWMPEKDPAGMFRDRETAEACRNIKGALSRCVEGITLLAVPVSENEPFPMMPVFMFGTPAHIEEKPYVIFAVKKGEIVG